MVLAEIVNDAAKKVKENNVFNADLRDEFKHYEYGQLTSYKTLKLKQSNLKARLYVKKSKEVVTSKLKRGITSVAH